MTWSGNLGSNAQSWAVLARIDGVGEYGGQYTFCNNAPTYGDSRYKALLERLPSILSERADITGGLPDAGACTLEVLDADDFLTGVLRTDRAPSMALTAAANSTTTQIQVGNQSALTAGVDVLHIGAEAMRVDYLEAGTYADFDNFSRVDYAGVGGLWGVSQFTVSGWMYWSASDTGEILRQEDGGTGYINLSTSSDRLRVQISAPTLASELSTSATVLSARDQWIHVAATYDAGTVTLYVDGSAIASGTSGTIPTSIPAASSPKTEIGTAFLGRLRHLAFWSGTSATAAQVSEIYGGGYPPDLQALATLASPTWWVECNGSFAPTVGAGTAVTVGSPALVTGTPHVGVTRGHLNTTALEHEAGDPVYLSPTFLAGRRFSVYLAPLTGSTAADERLVGTYLLESYELDQALNTWRLNGTSQLQFLDRVALVEPREAEVRNVGANVAGEPWIFTDVTEIVEVWPDGRVNLDAGGELIRTENDCGDSGSGPRTLRAIERGTFGSKRGDLEQGDRVTQVMLAGYDFRVSPGPSPSTDRATPTWNTTDNWVDVVLCIMLSSASAADGLELTNYRTTGSDWSRSNFASLPVGYGLGIPQSLIDWDAWEDVRARTRGYSFPFIAYGADARPFGDWLSENFLRPLGAFLTVESGTISITLPRFPAQGASSTSIGAGEILIDAAGRGQALPAVRVSRDKARAVGEVVFEVGPGKIRQTVRNDDFGRTYGQRGWYGAAAKPVTMRVPAGDPHQADLFAARGAALLYRRQRPPMQIEASTTMAGFGLAVGDVAALTLPEAPNMRDSSRGWSGRVAQVLEREVQLDGPQGAHMRLRLETYGDAVKIGYVAPSANVASVSGNVATTTTNRYTQADSLGGLPTDDAAAFSVDDVVKLIDRSGAELASGATQIVQSIAGADITLDGDFGGALAAGTVLTYADRADTTADQAASWVHAADRATQTVGATTETPWRWGEV